MNEEKKGLVIKKIEDIELSLDSMKEDIKYIEKTINEIRELIS